MLGRMGSPEASSPTLHPVDDPATRAKQQQRLRDLADALAEEGAELDQQALDALRARADGWPE